MTANQPVILVLNAGSSSLKFRVYATDDTLTELADGRVTGIGTKAEFSANSGTAPDLPATATQADALAAVLAWLGERPLAAVGHRIVHGGAAFTQAVKLDERIMAELARLNPLAPLHQPHNLAAVRAVTDHAPNVPQVGCFDTAFHAGHDPLFSTYAIPVSLRKQGVRRYGFHGLSYEWIASHPEHVQGRVVAAHLGNGASLCAMRDGKSIDTTMGMTALDGLPMGTRCGAIDPGVVLYMQRELGMNAEETERVLSYESGLLGLSGISNDVRALSESPAPEAAFALEYFATMTAQHIARMVVAIGGLDKLIFTGGIGENSATIREAIAEKLTFLPPFAVATIAANEEKMIAQHTRKVALC